jgi:hypothetical protein
MEQQGCRPGLIRDRLDAAIAVCCAGFITVLSLRAAFSTAPHKPHWLIPLNFTRLPVTVVGIVNVAFYVGLAWESVSLYRKAHPKERVLVVGWFNVIFLSPFQGLLSTSAATAIQWIKAAGMVAASIAAVMIMLKAPASADIPRATNKRGRSIMLGIVIGLFLAGALLYWIL